MLVFAVKEGDDAAAKAAHEKLLADTKKHMETGEKHGGGSDYIKSIVFGGLDGIITTFAIVAAVAGANLPVEVVILMGFSNLIADAISMGLGDYLSSKAEIDNVRYQRSKEEHECKTILNLEKQEMVLLYQEKYGYTAEEGRRIMDAFTSKYERQIADARSKAEADARAAGKVGVEIKRAGDDAENEAKENTEPLKPFIDHMVMVELEMQVPDEDENPAMDGVVTFFSFIAFGSVPMWFYVAFYAAGYTDAGVQFAVACVATAIAMFLLGVFKASLTSQVWYESGSLMLLNGALAAAAAYLIGWGLEAALGVSLADAEE